jgi:hypothetical protein
MAAHYSNNYNAIATDGTGHSARADGMYFAPSGYGKGDYNRKACLVTIPTGLAFGADGDTVSLMDFNSGDRLCSIIVSDNGGQGASTSDWAYGLYKSSTTSLGALVSAGSETTFIAAHDQSGQIASVDVFAGTGGDTDDWDRGKALWELINLSDSGTYEKDPHETWTLVATSSDAVATTATVVEWLVEVFYVPG